MSATLQATMDNMIGNEILMKAIGHLGKVLQKII